MWTELIARLVCRFRGHVPSFIMTSPIPGVTLMGECRRCHRLIESAVLRSVA